MKMKIGSTKNFAADKGLLILGGAALLLLVSAGFLLSLKDPEPVDVNFITRPFDATVYLDGKPAARQDKRPRICSTSTAGLMGLSINPSGLKVLVFSCSAEPNR